MAQKSITIIFLFSFLIGLLQPVLPLVEYYVFKESIIELFCENREVPETECEGSCYLTNQLKKSEEKSESPGNLINSEEIPNSFPARSQFLIHITSHDDELHSWYDFRRPDIFPHQIFHPPRS